MKQINYVLQKKGLLFGFFVMLICSGSVYAQSTITGQVTDDSGNVTPGVNVVIDGTSNGTSTDFDGNYSIEASGSDVLSFSFVGYNTEKITVGTQTTINVQMTADAQALDEVIVTIGYGTAKKSDLTGAVSQVTAKSFEDQPLVRAEHALQGRAAGVSVANQSGQPGGAVKVRIRGVNSITGNNSPLVVVDGVIGFDLSAINPNDIQTMDVLKDASATAIYGSRGSNGVILITTKKGRGKSKIDFEVYTSVLTVPKKLGTLGAGDFADLENKRRIRIGGNALFTDAEVSELYASGGTNYQDLFFQNGSIQNYQLSFSGQAEDTSYFISGNYSKTEGIAIKTGFERFSLRSNVSTKIGEKLEVGVNIFASRGTRLNNLGDFTRFQGSDVVKAVTWDPTTPLFNDNGDYNNYSTRALASLNYNPIANMNQSTVENIEDRISANFNLGWDIIDGLKYNMIAGTNIVNTTNERYSSEPVLPDVNYRGAKNTSYQVSNILTWSKEFGENHDLTVTGVYEFSGYQSRVNGYNANNLSLPLGYYLAELAAGQSINNNFVESSIQSGMLRGEYVWKSNLYVTGTVRVDESSVFRPDNRTGYFPSFAARYSFGNSGFIQDSSTFSGLSLRAGWGQVGNAQIAPYITFPTTNTGESFPFNGSSVEQGTAPGGYGNPDLTWETTTQTNIGVDVGFLNGRINFAFDWYTKDTEDLLLAVPVPVTNGGGSITQNIGSVNNTGFDIAIDAGIIESDKFNWDATLTYSNQKNEVTELYGGLDEIQGSFGSVDGQSRVWNVIQVGEPLGQFQGSTFLGTWKTSEAAEAAVYGFIPGDAKYLRDENGEKVISAIGNGTPTYFWGFNNTLTFGKFDLNVLFTGSGGFDVYNTVQGLIVGATGNQRSFLAPEQLNQWTPENETDIPAGGANDAGSTRYVEDGTFVRLQNLSAGYTFDIKENVTSSKVYVSGQNLFLISDYSGYDPELTSRPANNQGNVDTAAGINIGAYPNPRSFTLGVKLGF